MHLRLLPPAIRRDLSLGLSLVGVLHFEAAGLFHDVETTDVVESARKELLNYTLGTPGDWNLEKLVIPSTLPFLVHEKQLQLISARFEFA